MAFPKSVKDAAFKRSGGYCECKRPSHPDHPKGRCRTAISSLSVDYHHIRSQKAGGPDTLANCEALCRKCHRLTKSFGA
jgi:5-methylcytosine-specific restriction endonuclease McrA